MKKTIALFLILALTLVSALALAETDITGLWYADLGGAAATLTLNADGTYHLSAPLEEEITGAWHLDDGFVYLDGASDPNLATWGESTLILSDGTGFFTREEPWAYTPANPIENAPLELFAGYWVSQYVDVSGAALPVNLADDRADLYVEGYSAILGGPLFGDVTVHGMTLENGMLAWAGDGVTVQLQLQEDGLLRLNASFTEAAPQTFYLLRTSFPGAENEASESNN